MTWEGLEYCQARRWTKGQASRIELRPPAAIQTASKRQKHDTSSAPKGKLREIEEDRLKALSQLRKRGNRLTVTQQHGTTPGASHVRPLATILLKSTSEQYFRQTSRFETMRNILNYAEGAEDEWQELAAQLAVKVAAK